MRSKSAVALGAVALALALGGCGSDGAGSHPAASGITITDTAAKTPLAAIPTNCPDATLAALERVGHSVYEESASGRIVAQAAYRVAGSRALAEAVARGDARGARRVLRSLLLNQIVSIRVTRRGRTLAQIERGIGIAPVAGNVVLAGHVVGQFALSVQGANGYAQTTSGLTHTQVLLSSGARVLLSTLQPAPRALLRGSPHAASVGGIDYRIDTFAARVFPDRPVSVSLLVPASAIAAICKRGAASVSPAQAQADTWGLVAERVYEAEHAGSKAELILGVVERSRAFRKAVLEGNARATRAAIIGFFRTHLHVVRVRVVRAGRLLVDVGGPHVLAPIRGVIPDAHGRVAARFLLGIQDDLGFTILARAFTGAETVMRQGSREIMGTLRPGPPSIPDRGRVVYGGRSYQVYSFQAEAFPSGPLRISLLYPVA
jgi:hypothetical protein